MADLAIAAVIGGTLLSATSQMGAGNQADAAGKYNQAALDAEANTVEASSQRKSIEQRRQAALVASRAQAVAASSGAGASDATVQNTIADIAGQGELQALSELYNGSEQGNQLRQQGAMARFEGRQAQKASRLLAGSTVLNGASSLYSKYNTPVKGGSTAITWDKPDANGITWDRTSYR